MSNPIHKYDDPFGQEITFHIPDDVKNIGLRVSGGADSAIILYMTVMYCEQHIPDANLHILTCANPVKGWYNSKWSARVIDKVLQLTRTNLIKSHYTYFAETQTSNEMFKHETNMYKAGTADFFIHGTTLNPPSEIEYLQQDRYEPRDDYIPDLYFRNGNMTTFMPLRNVDKRMTAYLFYAHEVTRTLLPSTRSCEQHATSNRDIGTWMESSCKKCWWCKEKKWAFEEMEKWQ